MSFRNNGNSRNQAQGQDDSWKSQGFVNIYLTNADGSRGRKIGAIGLKDSKPFEAAMLKRLTEGGTEALQALSDNVAFDFQRTDKDVTVAALPF